MASTPSPSTWAAALALSLLALTPASGVAAGAAAGRSVAEPVTSSLRIATYNVSAAQPVSSTVEDLRELTKASPDVIALQEMASRERRNAVRAELVDCDTCAFDAYMPDPAIQGGTPILYRSDKYTLELEGSEQVTDDTYVGPQGAGPSTIRAKWINWVQLRDNVTGRLVSVLNNHFVPTVQAGDGGPNDQRRRVEIYRKHMEGLVAEINRIKAETGGTVFVTGDLNVNYRNDSVEQASMFPYHALGAVGVHSSFRNVSVPEEGTHVLESGYSKRLIDYVLNLSRRSVSSDNHRIIFGLASDHRALVSGYTLFGRGCFQRRQNIC